MESRVAQVAADPTAPTPSPNTAAREQARQNKLERNARVEAWRSIVAANATECTCTLSSVPSTVADSAVSSGNDASSRTRPDGDSTAAKSNPVSPATTNSREHQDEVNGAPAFCNDCARLGAPLFMGQLEFDEHAAVTQPRRALSITKAFRNFTRRLTLNHDKIAVPGKSKSSHEDAPTTTGTEAPPPQPPPPPAPRKPDTPSRDSFVESRKNKMKKIHRDLLRQGNAKSRHKSQLSIDLNRVNEALMVTSPTLSRPTTRADQLSAPAAPAIEGAGEAEDVHLSDSSSGSGSAADMLVRQRLKETARGIERLERAQRLLNRGNAKSANAVDGLAAQGAPPLQVRAPA